MEKHLTYILYSPTADIYYKGYTTNPQQRIQQHNNGESRYTKEKGPWECVFLREFDSKTNALEYEKMLKRQNRSYILWVIQQSFNSGRRRDIDRQRTPRNQANGTPQNDYDTRQR